MKRITVTIDEAGETSVDLSGFHGQGCAKVLDDFAAGEKAKVVHDKPEIRECERERQKQC